MYNQHAYETVSLSLIVALALLPILFITFAQGSSCNGLPPLEDRDVIIDTFSSESLLKVEFDSDQSLLFYPYLTNHQAAKSFALLLDGATFDDQWTIIINDHLVETSPIQCNGVAWYQIPSNFFRAGYNLLRLRPLSLQSPHLKRVLAFSLECPVEEDHFDVLAGGPSLFVQPPTNPEQDKMDVVHCKLEITLNMSSASITSGVLTLTAESLDSSLNTCVLDFNDNGGAMTVASVDSGPATASLPFTHNGAQDRVFITLPAPVLVGQQFTVRVFYNGTPAPNPYRRGTHNGVPVLYTSSQPYNARKWWPCKDIPGDKFTADIFITCPDTIYNGYPLYAVSNGKLISHVNNGNGTQTFHWESTYRIASQYISLACTNYRPAEGVYTALDSVTTMSVAHYVYPESYASESQELPRTIEVMEFYASKFGEYPFLAEKYYTATWGISSGMEHQTCTSMPNGNLNNPPYHRRNVHELAHMWFGDSVGIAHFNHLWISEGWATYCEALWKEHKLGIDEYHNQMNSWVTSDSYPIVSDNADLFQTSVVYYKAAWVHHMLRHVIGDAAFFSGAKNYAEDPNLRYGIAWSSDLQTHFETAYGSSLSWFFDAWLYQANRPDYRWFWSTRTVGSDTYIDIGIEQVQSGGYYTMPIDFRAEFQGGGATDFTVWNDQSVQFFSVNVGPGTVTDLLLDPDGWILDYNTEIPAPSGITDWQNY
jgi:aminopeptidase N